MRINGIAGNGDASRFGKEKELCCSAFKNCSLSTTDWLFVVLFLDVLAHSPFPFLQFLRTKVSQVNIFSTKYSSLKLKYLNPIYTDRVISRYPAL
jgi:hypothetical protein